MRSTFCLLLLVVCFLPAHAQIKKGSVMMTGNLSTSNDPGSGIFASDPNSAIDQLRAYASIGYLFSKRFALGVDFSYDYDYFEANSIFFGAGNARLVLTTNTFTPGIFGRGNFPLGQKFVIFIEGGAGSGSVNSDQTTYFESGSAPSSQTSDQKSKITNLRLKGGINYFITERIALECSPAQLNWTKTKRETGTSPDPVLDLSFGLQNLNFGIVFFLGGSD